jgi:hypothetical protein
LWPTDYYLADRSIEDRQFVEPDDEHFEDIIPDIGLVFKSNNKFYQVIMLRRWHSQMYTGYVREVDIDEWHKYNIKHTFGKNPDVEFPECEKIEGEQLALF